SPSRMARWRSILLRIGSSRSRSAFAAASDALRRSGNFCSHALLSGERCFLVSSAPSPAIGRPAVVLFVVQAPRTGRKYMKKGGNAWETKGRCLWPCDAAEVLILRAFLAGRGGRGTLDCYRIRSPHHFGGESEMRTSEPKPH